MQQRTSTVQIMATQCCESSCATDGQLVDPRYRRVLWIALAVNVIMFGVEFVAGLAADSVSLLADAIDFFGDAVNYGISLAVLALASAWRSRAALIKGVTMGSYGIFVLGKAAWNATAGTVPELITMGVIGFLALAANVSVAVMLYRYRGGDANMRSVWLCSRNDAIGNVAVLLAALGVFGTGSGWPDLAMAAVMGVLGVIAAKTVIGQAVGELRSTQRLVIAQE